MNIHYQTNLRPPVSTIYGPSDYWEFRTQIEGIDTLLNSTSLEANLLQTKVTEQTRPIQIEYLRMELRTMILLHLTNDSARKLAFKLADSELFRWFIGINELSKLRPPSKSSINRAERRWSKEEIAEIIIQLNKEFSNPFQSKELLCSDSPLENENVYADTTCVKANIHHPVDWLLFRDATKTIMNRIKLIRLQGICHRMKAPETFIKNINSLTIEMTQASRNRSGKKLRKKTLRKMKRLLKCVEKHGYCYFSLLKENWKITEWSENEVNVILQSMTDVLEQIPAIIDIAHRRIISEKKIPNVEKILSLYEKNVHVIKRGKFDAEVEFGNCLYLAEQKDGLIIDWDFIEDKPRSDTQILKETVLRIKANYELDFFTISTDRGFNSKRNDKFLKEENIFNATCPRDPELLKEKMSDEKFRDAQRRRASTEGRIGVFKNKFLGSKVLRKRVDNRSIKIAWSVLVHNLWVVARIANENRALRDKELYKLA